MRLIISIAIASILIVSGCIQQAAGKDTVKVGVILPLTGTSADAGNYVRQGLVMAQNEINSGTARKYSIDLVFEDSQYKSDIAVGAMQKLTGLDGAKFVVGEYGSSQTLAIAPIAEQGKIIVISPAAQSSKISAAGDYVFRVQVTTRQESGYLSSWLSSEINNSRIGIIAINTDYGVSYIDEFSESYKSAGGEIGLIQKYDTKEADFRTMLLKAKGDGEKYILILGTRKHNGLALAQSKELNMSFRFFASSPTEGKELIDTAGQAAEGLIYPYPFDSESSDSAMAEFQEKYRKAHGTSSEMLAANGYDVLHILSNCFEKAGTGVDSVKQCLYGTKDYKGASGTITFDDNGDVSKQFILKTVRNGTFAKYGDWGSF